jgi:hypothetical protein
LQVLLAGVLYTKLNSLFFSGLNTYVYAFTNLETRKAYATMFSKIFQVLGDVARHPVKFPHIHGGEEGIRVATVDMCKKQAPGRHLLCVRLNKLIVYRVW